MPRTSHRLPLRHPALLAAAAIALGAVGWYAFVGHDPQTPNHPGSRGSDARRSSSGQAVSPAPSTTAGGSKLASPSRSHTSILPDAKTAYATSAPSSAGPAAPAVATSANTSTIVETHLAAEREARVKNALRLAEGSPLEALRWATAQPPEFAGPAIIAAASEAAREHPVESLSALSALPESLERDDAITRAAAQWATFDAKSASTWAVSLTARELRERTCTAVAIAMADRDPHAAADFVATQLADGLSMRTAAVSVAQRWAQRDPAAAQDWVEQFPAGPIREDALREIAVQRSVTAAGTANPASPR